MIGFVRGALKAACATSCVVAVAAASVSMIVPALAATSDQDSAGAVDVSNASFTWAVNAESGGGSYFGGCNFLSAGMAGDNGSSGVWQESKGLYQTEDGNVSILKPNADGDLVPASWASKCTNQYGTSINGRTNGLSMAVTNPAEGTPTEQPTYSGNVVRFVGGRGTVDADDDSAHIEWTGSFTIVYYGGMTYWSLTDPVLDIVDGHGTITATASGYGADMDDPSVWKKLDTQRIHLADLQHVAVDIGQDGATLVPDYLGVAVPDDIDGRNPQAERTDANASWWGAMPASWLEYAELTGQTSYWYTSDGGVSTIQPRKPASPIALSWGASAKPEISASAAALQRGSSISFTVRNAAEGAQYQGSVRLPDGVTVRSAVPGADAGQWIYASAKDDPMGTYTFELRDAAAGADVQPVATLDFAVGDLPAAPVITAVDDPGSDRVTVHWKPADAAEGALDSTGFVVTATQTGSSRSISLSFAPDATQGVVDGLAASTAYDVTVAQSNALGVGAQSAAVSVVTAKASETPDPTPGDGDGNGDGNGGSDDGNADTPGDGSATLSNVVFRWGMNDEANSKSFFGACNYLSAGVAGDNGHSGVWDGSLYRSSDGNARIEKPNAAGQWEQASWQTRCLTPDGSQVTMGKRQDGRAISTQSQVVIDNGTGTRKADGSISIQWKGSWTVVFYDGMTYWSVSDPQLSLDANGNGSVTAVASGYGADMDNSSVWKKLDSRTIVIADLKGVDMAKADQDGGFAKIPEYLGVKVNAAGGRSEQAALDDTNRAYWGSFPQSFVDYMVETGQSSYWYTSDGQRDFAKPATEMTVQYDVSRFAADVPANSPAATTATGANATRSTAGTSGTNAAAAGSTGAKATAAQTPAKQNGTAAAAQQDATQSADASTRGRSAGASLAAANGQSAPELLIADTAGHIALGASGVAAATALPLGLGWVIRRRVGLDAGAELDRRLGLH